MTAKPTPLLDKVRFLASLAALNPPLNARALRMAIVLVNYYNHRAGYARPSEPTIAAESQIGRRDLARVRAELVRRKLFEFIPGSKGRGNSGRYIPLFENAPSEAHFADSGNAASERHLNVPPDAENAASGRHLTGQKMPHLMQKNAAPERHERIDAKKKDAKGARVRARGSASRRSPRHPIPADWQPTAAEADYAQERGLNVAAEAVHFRDYHRAKGNVFADVSAAWQMWCRKAVEFRTKDAKPSNGAGLPDPMPPPLSECGDKTARLENIGQPGYDKNGNPLQ